MAAMKQSGWQKCEPCLFDKSENIAAAFCVVCLEYLCENCSRDHQRNKLTRSHRVLTDRELPIDSAICKKMKELLFCSEHPEEKNSYWCEDHDQFVCIKCLAIPHRLCKNTNEIARSQLNKTLSSQLDDILHFVNEAKQVKTAKLESLRKQQEQVVKERTEFIKYLVDRIQKLAEKSHVEAELKIMPYLTELEEGISKCEEIEAKATSSKRILEVARQFGNEDDVIVISRYLDTDMEHLDEARKKEKESKDGSVLMIKFERNAVLRDITEIGVVTLQKMSKDDTNYVQSVQISSDELKENNTATTQRPENSKSDGNAEETDPMQCNIKYICQHSIRRPTDNQTCWVNAAVLLRNGQFVLTDRNNKKIKVFNNDFSFACEQALEAAPTDVCCVDLKSASNCIAAIEENTKCVKVYTHAENMFTGCKKTPTKLHCLSITWNQGSQICILSCDKPLSTTENRGTVQIEIRDMHDGRILKTIDVMKYFSGSCQLYCYRIHSTSRGAIIITENEKIHNLEKRNDEFFEKWFYKSHGNQYLESVADIDSDFEGNVYVCGQKSKNVHQVSAVNFWNSRIIIPDIKDPSAICVDSQNARIVIGRERDDNVHVFRWKN